MCCGAIYFERHLNTSSQHPCVAPQSNAWWSIAMHCARTNKQIRFLVFCGALETPHSKEWAALTQHTTVSTHGTSTGMRFTQKSLLIKIPISFMWSALGVDTFVVLVGLNNLEPCVVFLVCRELLPFIYVSEHEQLWVCMHPAQNPERGGFGFRV